MSSAKLTLIGMYNWDDELFKDMILPDGIDKDLFIASLLMAKGEFEVLYPDPGFMRNAIKIWSGKWFRTFSEWLKGTKATWNPIYNYDRYEESKDINKKEYGSVTNADYEDQRITDLQDKRSVNLQDERSSTLQDKRTADLQDKRSVNLKDERTADLNEGTEFNNSDTTSQMTDTTTEHLVSAYDSAGYSPSSKDIVKNGTSKINHDGTVDNKTTGTDTMDHTGTETTNTTGTDTMDHTGSDTVNQTGTDTMNHTGSDTLKRSGKLSDVDGHEKDDNIHSAHLYGNIGVTTSAAMLREFYDIAQWNLYEHIADVFSSELLISVY